MYYQTQLLPIDDSGNFLLAMHHAKHKVGGDDARETGHTYFALGHVDRPGELREVTAQCTLPRPASEDEAAGHEESARGQAELSRDPQYGKSQAEHYADNAERYQHAAALARLDGIYVPRRVLASREGRVLLAYESFLHTWGVPSAWGCLRIVDFPAGAVSLDESSSRLPNPNAGLDADTLEMVREQIEQARADGAASEEIEPLLRMLEAASAHLSAPPSKEDSHRLFFNQLTNPLGFSLDGSRVLINPGHGGPREVEECRAAPGLPRSGALPTGATFLAGRGHWVGIEQEAIVVFDGQGKERARHKVPSRSVLAWASVASVDSGAVAMPGESGPVWLVDLGSGKPRRFDPHRGIRRGAYVDLALSDCGRWMATRAGKELVVTRLEDGLSWPAASLDDRGHEDVSHGDYVVKSSVPAAFAFIGSRLFIAQDRTVSEVALGDPPAGVKAVVSERGREGARVPIRVPANATLEKMLKVARLDSLSERLRSHYSPGLRMKTKPLKKSGWLMPGKSKAPPLGQSRFGGWPDLPGETAWPLWQGRPMAFLAQVNLGEAHVVEPGLRLPKTGLLSFFLGCEAMSYEKDDDPRPRYLVDVMLGSEPAHRGAWRVIFTPDASELARKEYAATPLPQLFSPCSLKFSRGAMPLPDEQSAAYETLHCGDEEKDRYNELLGEVEPAEEHVEDQLMGYPNLIQFTPPELSCELASRGMNPYKFPQETDPEYPKLVSAAAEWGLLLQLTSNSDVDFLWGDAGHLYFYAHRAAMEQGDFSHTWVNYESH